MTLEKKHYIWMGVALLAVLLFFSYKAYSQQAETKRTLQDQARQLRGLQGSDTVTARDLLSTMDKNMQGQKPTINFTI